MDPRPDPLSRVYCSVFNQPTTPQGNPSPNLQLKLLLLLLHFSFLQNPNKIPPIQSLYLSENPQSLSRRVEDYGYGRRGGPTEATAANAERRQQRKLRDEFVEQAETDAEQGSQGGELRGPGAVGVQSLALQLAGALLASHHAQCLT